MQKFNEVLLVEEDPFERALLEHLISSVTGARIRLASHGMEALQQFDAGVIPQLVLADLHMPEMGAIELLHRLAQRGFEGYVILLSAVAEDELEAIKQVAASYGFCRVEALPKPVSPQRLEALLEQYQQNPLLRDWQPQRDRKLQRNGQQPSEPTEKEVLAAFALGLLQPYFQPQLDARSQRVVGAEALVRWVHPRCGILGPKSFLSQLSASGRLPQLTLQILNQAVAACARWHRLGRNFSISVNLAPSDLLAEGFAGQVLEVLEQQGLAPQFLTLELSETEICPPPARLLEAVSRLRMRGVKLAIDDFGSGHSSLQQLAASPLSELKIDRQFVAGMLSSARQRLIVKLAARLAQKLGLMMVAKGVETQPQADYLDELGCDRLQGFLYAPALPEQQFLSWADRQQEMALAGAEHS